MHRRNILTAALAGAGGLIAAATATRRASATPDKSKVVTCLISTGSPSCSAIFPTTTTAWVARTK